jgi:hypothetical protein
MISDCHIDKDTSAGQEEAWW